ncbi:MAG: PadR family transcriptional regulator [Lachnospiraceae bacterium]|nr:PadR family transcriptional regulator [Lachnospiraceae bacterium]
MLKHGILGLLNYGPMTGYEIKTVFQDSLSYFWTAQTSQIYRELQSLKKKAWVKDELILQKGRPDKRLCSITDTGKEELRRWLSDISTVTESNSPLLMKTFFLGELPIERSMAFFRQLLDNSTAFLEGIRQAEETVGAYQAIVTDPYKSLYWELTLEYGVMYKQMTAQWAARCIERLKEVTP